MSEDSSSTSEIQQRSPLKGWWIAPVALLSVAVLFFAAQVVGSLIIYAPVIWHHWSVGRANSWLMSSVEAQFVYSLVADGLLVAGIAWMLKWLHWRWADIGIRKPQWQHMMYGLLSAVPYYLLYFAVVAILGVLVPSLNIEQKQDVGFSSVQGAEQLIVAFVSLVVLPPLAEEVTMRGFFV